MPEVEKVEKKQKASPRSKVNMWALWAAVLTSLGTQGIPELVRLIANQPTTEQIQKMIADQTTVLTEAQNKLVDAANDLAAESKKLEDRVNHLEGQVDSLTQLCCSRAVPGQREKPVAAPTVSEEQPGPPLPPPAAPDSVMKLEKTPAFDASQVKL